MHAMHGYNMIILKLWVMKFKMCSQILCVHMHMSYFCIYAQSHTYSWLYKWLGLTAGLHGLV